MIVVEKLTKEAVLGLTPVSGTETTSCPRLADTVLVTILVLLFTSVNGLDNVTGVVTSPLLPELDGPLGHRGREEGLRSRSSEGREGEGEESECGSELHFD